MNDIFENYANKICPTCKGECHKGICVVFGNETKVQCVDYEKDESKIKKPESKLERTAKQKKSLMGFTQNY